MEYQPVPNRTFMAKFDRFEPIFQDSTAMKLLKKCDRLFFYVIVLGYRPRKQKYQANMDFGTMRHKFRETLEKTSDVAQAMQAATKVKISEADRGYEFLLDKLKQSKTLALDYQNWEKEKTQNRIKVLYIEQILNTTLPDGSVIAGRIDQGIEWSGQIWDRDWKTSSKPQMIFADQKDPDDQATRYIYILSKLHGKTIGGVVFDVIYNTKTVGPESFTHIVSKTPKQLAMWEGEQVHLNKQLALNRQEDKWPMREGSCQFCDFKWVCRQSNEQAQMAKLQSDFVHNPWDFTKVGEE